jgi:primase-like protein
VLFLQDWQINPDAMQIYFSGSKGFHLMLDARLFGKMFPSKNLPLVFDSMRRHLAQEIPEQLRETVDLAIKDRVRLLRLPNTVHENSKLTKVILSVDELNRMSADDIRSQARTVRPLALTDETGLVSKVEIKENATAVEFIRRIQRQVKKLTRKPFRYRFNRPPDLARIVFPCAGLQGIWESHVEPGFRNSSAIRLASALRLLGLSSDETHEKLLEWNERNGIGLPYNELHNVVHSAYQHRFPYRYSCRDEILRRFCPLPDVESCQSFVLAHAAPSEGTQRSS